MTTENKTRKSIAEEFAGRIVEELKAGTAPWQKPWKAGERILPFNPSTGTIYRGVNTVMLARHGYADPRWMTMRQANEQEWRIKKGSKAQQVVFWQWTDRQPVLDGSGQPVLKDGQEVKETVQLERPRLHIYSVFHASQMQTRDGEDIPPYEPQELAWDPIERGEAILRNSGASISHDQRDRAFYRLDTDEIHLPPREHFPDTGNYYSTALHELGHWTGNTERLNRAFGPHGSEQYAKEELRAEIAIGIQHHIGHLLHVGNALFTVQADLFQGIESSRCAGVVRRIKTQDLVAPALKVPCGQGVIFPLDIEHNRRLIPGKQSGQDQPHALARAGWSKTENMFRAIVTQVELLFFSRIIPTTDIDTFAAQIAHTLNFADAGPMCRAVEIFPSLEFLAHGQHQQPA